MVKTRLAKITDLKEIQEIEKEYYEGFLSPEKVSEDWIKNCPGNFFLALKNKIIKGFIFFEYLEKIKALPFIHEPVHEENGKYAYISNIGISEPDKNVDVAQKLFEEVLKKSQKDGCIEIIWLTGVKRKHDKVELSILMKNGFIKKESISSWEAYPGHFVSDHAIWQKKI